MGTNIKRIKQNKIRLITSIKNSINSIKLIPEGKNIKCKNEKTAEQLLIF